MTIAHFDLFYGHRVVKMSKPLRSNNFVIRATVKKVGADFLHPINALPIPLRMPILQPKKISEEKYLNKAFTSNADMLTKAL